MLTYEEITAQDLPTITQLYAKHLTAGQSLADGTYAAWERGDCFGTKAVEDGEIAGFFSVRKGLEFTYPHPELEAEVMSFVGARRLYVVDGMLVLPDYRGRGVASRLVAETLPRLKRVADLVLVEIWVYPDGSSPGKKAQEKLGEVVFRKLEPMFYREFPRYGMRCPICGESCVCGAWIDVIKI